MDHISIPITNTARTRAFYAACLAPLGWVERGYAEGRYVGFHKAGEAVLGKVRGHQARARMAAEGYRGVQ